MSHQKVLILFSNKNKRPLNFNDLSLETKYLKNGAEKGTRTYFQTNSGVQNLMSILCADNFN